MRLRLTAPLFFVVLSLGTVVFGAQAPLNDMRLSIGYLYTGAGQNITEKDVASSLLLHAGTISIEPFWWLSAGFIAGGQSLRIDPFVSVSDKRYHDFNSDYNFGAGWRLAVRSPGFFPPALRLVGRFMAFYFTDEDSDFCYDASLSRFNTGVSIRALEFMSLESGVASHVLNGMMGPESQVNKPFANTVRFRPYLSFDFLSNDKRFFSGVYFDISSKVRGPVRFIMHEATVAVEAGYVLSRHSTLSRRWIDLIENSRKEERDDRIEASGAKTE